MSLWVILTLQGSALACAILGGVFLAFSDFLMRAFNLASAPAGAEVMQVINREVFRHVFIPVFLAMVPISVALAGYGYVRLTGPAAVLIMLAAMTYLVGVFGVTVAFNVPLNNRLAAFDDGSAGAQAFWSATYLRAWTNWNTLRTVAALTSAGLFLAAATTGIRPA